MRLYSILSALVLIQFFGSGLALAQSPPADVIRRNEQIQNRQQENLDEQRRRLLEGQDQGLSGSQTKQLDPELQEGDQCVQVASVHIQGMEIFDQSDFSPEVALIEGRCARLNEINALIRKITNSYIERGYITSRGFIRPGGLETGQLNIAVVEGRVENITGAQNSSVGPGELFTAFPFAKKGLLNLRGLEQGIDQLNRLASVDATLDIEPGEVAGTSRVLVRQSKIGRPYRFSFNVDNNGQQSTGRVTHTAGFEYDSLFGLNDFWSAYYSRDARYSKETGTEAFGGYFSIPFGHSTLAISGGKSSYESRIEGLAQTFSSTGSSWNILAELDHVIYRDGATKISIAPSLQIFDADNFIEDVRLLSSSYDLSILGAQLRLQRAILGGVLSATFEGQRGINILGATAVDFGPDSPGTKFTSAGFTSSYFRPFDVFEIPFRYTTVLRGKWNFSPVFPVVRLSLGGPGTIRGFRDDGISGRRGLFNRHEISKDIVEFGSEGGFLPKVLILGYLGYDWGGILSDRDDPFERGVLHGATFGLRSSGGPFFLDFGVSVPISAPQFVERKDIEFSASLRVSF